MISSSVGTGDYATALFALQRSWPKDVTSASFQAFYSEVTDKAERAGFFPQDDHVSSAQLRSSWWHVLIEPVGASPHWAEIIKLALISVQYRHSTIAEMEAFFVEMVNGCDHHERTARNNPRSVGSIRFAGGDVVDVTEEQELVVRQALDGKHDAAPRRGTLAHGYGSTAYGLRL